MKDFLSGIPQGSVLGPLLIILFINGLPDYVKSRVKIFADDLKLIGNASDRTIIDKDLENLELWEKRCRCIVLCYYHIIIIFLSYSNIYLFRGLSP